MINSAQIKAARALLGINQMDLSKMASLSIATVKRIEAAPKVRGAAETLLKLQTALEKAGVVFIPADQAGGSGVRLREAPSDRAKRRRSR
jgi:transcriptional regulator with XRE-family HTH domain